MAHEKFYENGWVQLSSDTYLISAYWLDGFDTAETPEEERRAIGPEKRISPIYSYDDGGIGAAQWVNATYDKAAILQSDGGWKTGGIFHLWISPGAGRRPYEVLWKRPTAIAAGGPWEDERAVAVATAEAYLGLRLLFEAEG